jgi:3-oxoadipate enol-lactonase
MTAVDLAHDDAGEGPVVVLIHGHPFNQSMWTPQLAALRDSFRVIAPDLCGYGDSPITPGTMPMAQLAADVRHLLDAKGIATGALVGLSMGGLVVMELTAAQPHRWWAYGFIATTAQRVTAEEQQARRASARTMQEQGMRPVAEQMADRLFGPDPSAELTATVMGMMLATSPAGAAAAVRGRAEHRPPAEHLWNRAACRPAIRSLPMSAVDGDRLAGASATRQTRRGGPQARPPGCRLSPPTSSVTMRYLKPAPSMTRRWPRTGSACRPAIRFRNAG